MNGYMPERMLRETCQFRNTENVNMGLRENIGGGIMGLQCHSRRGTGRGWINWGGDKNWKVGKERIREKEVGSHNPPRASEWEEK